MKFIIWLLKVILVSTVAGYQEIFSRSVDSCHLFRDVTQEYRISVYEFTSQAYKDIGPRSSYHFTFPPLSVWIILAALAEGADPYTQRQMFSFLRLPDDPCERLSYYQLATSRYLASSDVNIVSTRSMFVDNNVALNPHWYNFVANNRLIDLSSVPLRDDPQGTLNAISLSSASLTGLDLSGNSILVDTMDYDGLWSTAFSDAVVQRSPFYNNAGLQIGEVDLMRVTKRARVGFVASINAKLLDLPIGSNGRYRMLFALLSQDNDIEAVLRNVKRTLIIEYLESARESYVPVEIAIPRFTMTSKVNVRKILETLGITGFWTNPNATRYISKPPALPSSFVQRSTITLDNQGILSAPVPYSLVNVTTDIDPIIGREFVANRPFLFGLFDAETYTCLMSSIYSKPTYTY
uniref:Serpin domain-containing protein n=1 Tax=Heliothis virescens TaxID=7102 RepID=A0A2A4J277_HELVI